MNEARRKILAKLERAVAATTAKVAARAAATLNPWPDETPEALRAFYGEPGDRSNLVRVKTPYPIYYGCNLVSSVRLHKLVAASFVRVLENVKLHYTQEQISALGLDCYSGSFNDRNMRGGTRKSTHAWGIAIDWDAENNKLHDHAPDALFSHIEYEAWWQCWEAEGWCSLGRERDYDWMHVQACKRV